MIRSITIAAFAALSLTLLAACSEDQDKAAQIPQPTRDQIMFAEEAEPTDERLADLYVTSCGACHTVLDSGAPLTGFTAAWQPRLDAKGMAGLIASTKAGLEAMPPMGQCPDCTDDDFEALISFMMTPSTGGAE